MWAQVLYENLSPFFLDTWCQCVSDSWQFRPEERGPKLLQDRLFMSQATSHLITWQHSEIKWSYLEHVVTVLLAYVRLALWCFAKVAQIWGRTHSACAVKVWWAFHVSDYLILCAHKRSSDPHKKVRSLKVLCSDSSGNSRGKMADPLNSLSTLAAGCVHVVLEFDNISGTKKNLAFFVSVCSSSTHKQETQVALCFLWLVGSRLALLMSCSEVHSASPSPVERRRSVAVRLTPRICATGQAKKKLHLWLKTPLASQFSWTNKTSVNMTSEYATAVKIWGLFVYY